MTPARPRKVKEPKLTKGYKKDSVKAPAPMKIGTGGRGILGMFGGKETKREEKAEANAVKSGRITPKQYAAGEKKEGHGKGAMRKGLALRAGKLSPSKYASEHEGMKDKKQPKSRPNDLAIDTGVDPRFKLDKTIASLKKPTMATKGSLGRKLVRPGAGVKPAAAPAAPANPQAMMKKGGKVKKYARGGGIEVRGKTKGRII